MGEITLERLGDLVHRVDSLLDRNVSPVYKRQELAQDWARVSKAVEEVGEAIAALISLTGQNPRKPQRDEALSELFAELADIALTGLYGLQHFTKNIDMTMTVLFTRAEKHYARLCEKS